MPAAIGRLFGPRFTGTAFAFSGQWAVTALHVLTDTDTDTRAQGSPIVAETAMLALRTCELTVEVDPDVDYLLDVALLRLPGLPRGYDPVPLSADLLLGMSWWSTGYSVADGHEVVVDGKVTSADAVVPGRNAPAFVLRCQQASAAAPQALAGLSGAPVLNRDGAAIGMIRWQPTRPEHPTVATGGAIYGTPIPAMGYRWPHVVGGMISRHSRDARYRRLRSLLRTPVEPDRLVPAVAEVDRYVAGVRRTAESDLRGRWYDARPADQELRRLVREKPFVLAVGVYRGSSGVTRAAFEALLAAAPDHGLIAPRPDVDLHELVDLDSADPIFDGPVVLWLDDLDCYLKDPQRLDLSVLLAVARRPDGGTVVATISNTSWLWEQEREGSAAVRAVLAQATVVEVPGRDPKAEDDQWRRFRASQGDGGAALYLARKYEEQGDPQAAKWLQRAADLGQPAAVIELARECYWRGDRHGARRIIEPHATPIQPELVIELVRLLDAIGSQDEGAVEALIRQIADAAGAEPMCDIAHLYHERGDLAAERRWWQRAATCQHGPVALAHYSLAVLDHNDQRRRSFAPGAADAGSPAAMTDVAEAKAEHGPWEEAVTWYRRAWALGHRPAFDAWLGRFGNRVKPLLALGQHPQGRDRLVRFALGGEAASIAALAILDSHLAHENERRSAPTRRLLDILDDENEWCRLLAETGDLVACELVRQHQRPNTRTKYWLLPGTRAEQRQRDSSFSDLFSLFGSGRQSRPAPSPEVRKARDQRREPY